MTAESYINKGIPTLQPLDIVEEALVLFNEQKVSFLPYINGTSLLGVLSEDLLLNYDSDLLLSEIQPIILEVTLNSTDPLIEMVRKVTQIEADILPVVSPNNEYLGSIEKLEVYQAFISSLAINEVGGSFEINLKRGDYTLSDISRIIENENGKIISLSIHSGVLDDITLSLKLDVTHIGGIINALQRFGYDVVSYHSTEPVNNLEKDRFDLLMKYLSI